MSCRMGLSISVTAPSPFMPPWRPEAARSSEALPARHTSQEFVRFLQEVVATQPSGKEIHLIVDNLSAHKTKRVERLQMPWLSDWVLQQPVCDSLHIRDSRSKDPPRA
jgi:DDE superfamily endonuclease